MNDTTCYNGIDLAKIEQRDSSSVGYHRHCQATVLPARGTDGSEGLTWNVIEDLEDKLINLPSGWLDTYFSKNENITCDLAGVLKVVNATAESLKSSLKHSFTLSMLAGTKKIDSQPINPDTKVTYDFDIGKMINLSINDQRVSFYALRTEGDEGDETLTIQVPEMNHVVLPANKVTSDKITLDKNHHIYYMSKSLDFTMPEIDWSSFSDDDGVIAFELHIMNTSNGNITMTAKDEYTGLTDQLYIEGQKTNAYVFRIHLFNSNKVTYSLAYVY